jgi:predicted ribosome quality control (RQC) complex YloA/Tae2 family protein
MKEIEYEDIIYQLGTDANDNWTILHNAKQNWLWFHLDNVPSPYVILTGSLKEIKLDKYPKSWKNYIIKAGLICKENSKYKNREINIIWTEVKNVSKGSKPGEAIIKGKIRKFTI